MARESRSGAAGPLIDPELAPMLATPGELPAGPGWAAEVKWDGARCLVAGDGAGGWAARARHGADFAARFPELAVVGELGRDVLLDGELVVPDGAGRPDFGLLQPRLAAARREAGARAAVLMVFDLLRLDGRDTAGQPYRRRRARLEGLGLEAAGGGTLVVPPCWVGGAEEAWEFTRERGLEGVVSKRLDAPYEAGVRSPNWIKTRHRQTVDALVVGWRSDPAGRAARSLLLAVADGGLPVYAGRVGSGIGARDGRRLAELLAPLETARPAIEVPPEAAHDARWVEPRVVVEVRHLERTHDGHLRQPVFARIRHTSTDTPEY